MNNGHSTSYFPLSSGTRQGDPVSAYLFDWRGVTSLSHCGQHRWDFSVSILSSLFIVNNSLF